MMNNNYEYDDTSYQPTRQEFDATLVPPVSYIDLTDDEPQEYSFDSTTSDMPIGGTFYMRQYPYVNDENRTPSNLNGFQTVIPHVNQMEVNFGLTPDNESINNLLKRHLLGDYNFFSILGESNSTFPNSRPSGITTQTSSDSSLIHFQRDDNQIKMKVMKAIINGQKKTIAKLQAQVVNEKQLSIFRAEEQRKRSDKRHEAFLRKINELGRLLEEVKGKGSGATRTITQSSNPFINWKCSICWDSEASNEHHPMVAPSCGHIFHNSCIQRAQQDSHQCPLCKRPLNFLTKLFVG